MSLGSNTLAWKTLYELHLDGYIVYQIKYNSNSQISNMKKRNKHTDKLITHFKIAQAIEPMVVLNCTKFETVINEWNLMNTITHTQNNSEEAHMHQIHNIKPSH
jgi:hypothetical protein